MGMATIRSYEVLDKGKTYRCTRCSAEWAKGMKFVYVERYYPTTTTGKETGKYMGDHPEDECPGCGLKFDK